MALYDVVKDQVDAVIAEYKALSSDGTFTLAEAWTLTQKGVAAIIKIVDSYNESGPDKKAAVMQAAERFYDEVVAPLDIKAVPNFLEPSFDKFAKVLFLELINGSIDAIVSLLKGKG